MHTIVPYQPVGVTDAATDRDPASAGSTSTVKSSPAILSSRPVDMTDAATETSSPSNVCTPSSGGSIMSCPSVGTSDAATEPFTDGSTRTAQAFATETNTLAALWMEAHAKKFVAYKGICNCLCGSSPCPCDCSRSKYTRFDFHPAVDDFRFDKETRHEHLERLITKYGYLPKWFREPKPKPSGGKL